MDELPCPRCRTDQIDARTKYTLPELEGRDWYCSGCNAYLMLLDGRLSIVQVLPPMDP